MSLGERIINAIEARRDRVRKSTPGPHGDFYRNGGKELLYDLPVTTGSRIIDAGGYEGEWTARMIVRYGCLSEIYEPLPVYADRCRRLFAGNKMVRVHEAALGGAPRMARIISLADGSSEFRKSLNKEQEIEALVEDVSLVFDALGDESVACLKLNIEGAEYEVLERLVSTNQINKCNSLLVQFHAQPDGWERRFENLVAKLKTTHERVWYYPLLWEKWVRRDDV